MIFKNPSGNLVEIEDVDTIKELKNTPGFHIATPEEERRYILEQKATFEDDSLTQIQYITHSNENNGYATSQKQFVDGFLDRGIALKREYKKQKIGIAYGYPYLIEELRTPIKVLFTMFESTKIPSEWIPQLKRADLVLVPSNFCKEVFHNFGIETVVIPLGYDTNIFKPQNRSTEDKPFTFIHYDAMNNRKGWDIVFKAFNEEFKKDEPVKLIFKTTKEDLPFPILKSQYPNIELIKGAVEYAKLPEIISRADCGVFPSRGEGFGLTPLETLALGIPSIIPNAHGFAQFFNKDYFIEVKTKGEIPALYEFFMNRDMGKMIEVDREDLKKQMRYAFNHRSELLDMGFRGYSWARENYSIENTIDQFVAVLKRFEAVEVEIPEVAGLSEEDAIIFLSEDTQHITGGRYYSWWLATALRAAGHRVIVYTNREPMFLSEFSEYPQPELRIERNLSELDVIGKAYVGSPTIGSEAAIRLGKKYSKPTYIEVFDPFPMKDKYFPGHKWGGWDTLIEGMREPNITILSLCKTTTEYIREWLYKTKGQVKEVYPCINDRAREKAKQEKKENWITFISRLDYHKNLEHVLNAVKATDCELHVITSIDGMGFPEMVHRYGMRDRVVIHHTVSDKEKFEIIKKSRATINAATYEGFGMWLTESLSCGVPAVCYDFPTFREIESMVNKNDRLVYFAEYNNPENLAQMLKKALEENKSSKGTRAFDFPSMVQQVSNSIVIEPRIGVITIALNEQEFISSSLRSMLKMKNVKKIAVVEGCVALNESQATPEGLSTDDTMSDILNVISEDRGGKIFYERYGFAATKAELRNRALQLLGNDIDYVMIVDADEVWKEEDFNKLIDHVKKNPINTTYWYTALHFWKTPGQIAKGGQWDEYLFRFFKYADKSLHWKEHHTPVVNSDGVSITELGPKAILADVEFYHYGAMKPQSKILAKLDFYRRRDKDLQVVDTWSNWEPGKPTQWTHGGGTVRPFNGEHPEEMKDHYLFIHKK